MKLRLFFILIILCLLRPFTSVYADEPRSVIHVVQSGETLLGIAHIYNTSVEQLAHLNQLSNLNVIYTGQRLILPLPKPLENGATHWVQPGETLTDIANHYGLQPTMIQAANGLSNPDWITAGTTLSLPQIVTPTTIMAVNTHFSPTITSDSTISSTVTGVPSISTNSPVGTVISDINTSETTISATMPVTAAIVSTVTKRILVDLSEQQAYTYEDDQLVHQFIVSTGELGRETVVGTYHIQNKLPVAYAYTWGLEMPNWMGIYWAGHLQNGFHALPILPNGKRLWQGNLGKPVSYGCVILGVEDAQTLYRWSEVGTVVTIRE
ncbi:MAG: LysM peptidoglycan-binding domain-containing protein [Chloroflexota bacterium]